jgi:hypothetical protein
MREEAINVKKINIIVIVLVIALMAVLIHHLPSADSLIRKIHGR